MGSFNLASLGLVCVSLAGCASTLTEQSKLYEGGRFAQMFYNDAPFMQVDWPTPKSCENALRTTKVEAGQGMMAKCGVESLADRLPFGGSTTDILFNAKRPIHFASPAMCEVMKIEAAKSNGLIECAGTK